MIRRLKSLFKRTTNKPAITKDVSLNVHNILALRSQQPEHFDIIRLDSINNCNVKCVYCHNYRSSEQMDVDDLKSFLEHNVLSTNNFQLGCNMEPTMDRRMTDFLLLIANSGAKPKHAFILQTNGILLHMHDAEKIRDAGVTHLSVSVDSVVPEINEALRGGANLDSIRRNLVDIKKVCPSLEITLISTITRLNVETMASLVQWGLALGVTQFIMREVFFVRDSFIVDRAKMPELLLRDGEFAAMKERVNAEFSGQANFIFADSEFLDSATKKMKDDSLL